MITSRIWTDIKELTDFLHSTRLTITSAIGVYILMASLLALVFSSLFGMLRAVRYLCYSMAQDDILPERFKELNDMQIPAQAILLVVLVSLPIPFIG